MKIGFLLLAGAMGACASEVMLERAVVVFSGAAGTVERNAAKLLSERLRTQTGVPAEAVADGPDTRAENGLVILLGMPSNFARLRAFLEEQGVRLPTRRDPGPEGYVIRAAAARSGVVVGAAGADERGTLYAVGELLRRTVARSNGFGFPADLAVRTAPAFRIRGTEVSQGGTMRELTRARAWKDEEWRRAAMDYVLAGANTLSAGGKEFAFLKSFGLTTHGAAFPNRAPGHPEWQAIEPIGRTEYVCLSIPQARKAALEHVEQTMKGSLPHDIIRIASGDPGGCWCEKCEPWGKTYMLMCEDMAKIILKYLPRARIYITNQELSNAGDRFIFDYLNQAPRPWLAGIYYGPGSNAMSWNGTKRPDHRGDLFEYPAFGLFGRYLQEMLHELPRRHSIQLFTDVTHWIASQYGLLASDPMADLEGQMPPPQDSWFYQQRPDPALLKVYNRRAFFARPRAYYRIFQQTMQYGEGDITYSEGQHDHFNQWMWQRLLWAPHTPLEDVMLEYSKTFFGPEAAPLMAEAILQLETNLTTPLLDNEGVDRYYRLVKEAGGRMTGKLRAESYLWREYMQRACLDRYIQLRLRRQTEVKREIEQRFEEALRGGNAAAAVAFATARLREPADTAEMARLRAEAGRLGDESEALFGLRDTAYFNLDQDLAGLGWIERQVRRAATGSAAARLIARYEDPGEGGFYDDAGNPARSPHMTGGRQYSANNYIAGNVSNGNLASQRTMAYTEDEARGVTFEYKGLDRTAEYRVRFAFVRPRYLARYAMLHPQKSQSIYADGRLLAENIEVPEWDAEIFEYSIPREVTADGEVAIWLKKAPDVAAGRLPLVKQWKRTAGWGTIVSDVWLLRQPK